MKLSGKTLSPARYLTRATIMQLLSDEEIARVISAEALAHVSLGEEYVDLERLAHGVRRARGRRPIGRLVPRNAVDGATWATIVRHLTPTLLAFARSLRAKSFGRGTS
jgi:hypothetical protein